MVVLILGLVVFLGVHSVRIVAEDWRTRRVAGMGEGPWKGLYSLIALVGFVLIVWGYGLARQDPVVLWTPPRGMAHLAALLTLPAFVLLVAAYVPRNAIRARVHHPMILGVKLWALAHLLANGTLADVVLFGAFLLWAVFDFRSARRRAPDAGAPAGRGSGGATAATLLVGVAAWALFAFWAHGWLIGVRPFGM
ncbi:NnrU family protein [Ramlibacter rhizophilus]|uniref:Protein NrnU n=1 Tax=Ramlibacter rhizophilus TaxID=1781167 RepID=A0A4Z0BHU8_9BURK|nr:NnrU family protein [Ramlibacter rhizophilus]TFY97969.1 protein NrnU [Ramlibacter rhizophilus]